MHLMNIYLLTVGGTFSYARKVVVNLRRQLNITFHQLYPLNDFNQVADFKTIHKCMDYYHRVSSEVNMLYTNIILEVEAAINGYKYFSKFIMETFISRKRILW